MVLHEFIHESRWEDFPSQVHRQARRCLLDTAGIGIGGRRTKLSAVIHDFAAAGFGGAGASLWLDGRPVSPPGAALANAATIDSLDMHDSCRPVKGHAGVALLPAALATLFLAGPQGISGRELVTSLVVGYEVAIRAGKALHATACDYHTSGAWNALGCAAIVARRLGLSESQTRHALGIAEYHGPRSQMMRCIDHPTMLKDGSGWGAMAGVSAGLLASRGFTGAPALTVEEAHVAPFWEDLGSHWSILEQYFKPYAVCYWAQPAIAGALQLQREHSLQAEDIHSIRVFTFHEASRLAATRPADTEQAQYSLPFPLAAALINHRLGYDELSDRALQDPVVLELAEKVDLIEDETFNARFPADRLSRVVIETSQGGTFDSGETRAWWDLSDPPEDGALRAKFRELAGALLAPARMNALEEALWNCARLPHASAILDLLVPPPDGGEVQR